MFRKLKQKIEQEGSPNAKVKVSESAGQSSNIILYQCHSLLVFTVSVTHS